MVEFERDYIVKVSESVNKGDTITRFLAYIGIGACHWLVWNEDKSVFQVGAEMLGINETVAKRSKIWEQFLVIPWRRLVFTTSPNAQLMLDEELKYAVSNLDARRKSHPAMKSYDAEYAICYSEWKRRDEIKLKRHKRIDASEPVEVEDDPLEPEPPETKP